MKKFKILMISDHLLSTSGVGIMSRIIANGLVATGKYQIFQLGAAISHTSHELMQPHPDIIIKPVDHFGTPEMLRQILVVDKPDAMFLFTDPRFFMHIFNIEDEIHQICPILYNNIWDNLPAPIFNKPLYSSVDFLGCINEVSYSFCKEWFPEKTKYIPHAFPTDMNYPLPDDDKKEWRKKLLGEGLEDHFVGLWINRNARRKQPGDLLMSWKLFLDQLEKKYGHRKAKLILHTDPYDQEGSNLYKVVEMLGIKQEVFFSPNRLDFEQMNVLHNVSDFYINISSAEGFGLGSLSSAMCGVPNILLKTGGQTRQIIDCQDGTENGVAIEPDVISCVGSQMVPFIFDSYVKHESVSGAIMKMYEFGPEKRKQLGEKARQYSLREYNVSNMISDWDNALTNLIETWRANKEKIYKSYEVKEL